MARQRSIVPVERIQRAIIYLRSEKVMLDRDLADLYGVETKVLNLAVRRNRDRFPPDFMFQLNAREFQNLRFQFETSSWGGRRFRPYAFTEQGVAMLSSVLNSPRAIQVNVEIMRTFVRLRQLLTSNAELARRLDALEKTYDRQFKAVFDAIRELMRPKPTLRPPEIGFHTRLPKARRTKRPSINGRQRPLLTSPN